VIEVKTVFQFYFRPTYNKPNVNISKASALNILRSLIVGRLRYCLRLIAHWRMTHSLRGLSVSDIASLTALCRPGEMTYDPYHNKN
jgi:hypothetical protein